MEPTRGGNSNVKRLPNIHLTKAKLASNKEWELSAIKNIHRRCYYQNYKKKRRNNIKHGTLSSSLLEVIRNESVLSRITEEEFSEIDIDSNKNDYASQVPINGYDGGGQETNHGVEMDNRMLYSNSVGYIYQGYGEDDKCLRPLPKYSGDILDKHHAIKESGLFVYTHGKFPQMFLQRRRVSCVPVDILVLF